MSENTSAPDTHAEDQDELDAVPIEECGELLVDFLEVCPALLLSPRHPVFEFPRVHLVRESVAKMLCDAASRLPDGLRLQIVEGYRPMAVQREHFKHALQEARKRFPAAGEATLLREAGRYSAPPDAVTPPPHLTGGAVDVSIVRGDGSELDFISPFEMMDLRHAAMNARGLSEEAEKNRALLREILEPTGLTNYVDEWWHWSYGDNGWALRVGAEAAIYDKIEVPSDAHWVGDMNQLPL
ncbi:MAG: D-alanyl-D-alanine carboxypeptidase family protein [Armatimonadetes bacterium]|nr:D-alanyl-D-alanine carboxypeptidase family protein [Armatimonadota bacterium]